MNKKVLIGLIILLVIVFSATLLHKDSWKVIDLRKSMPKGNFLEASIVQVEGGKVNYTWLEKIPNGKMSEFETAFKIHVRKAIQDAKENPRTVGTIMKNDQLRIVTDKGNYAIYLIWTDDYVRFEKLYSKEFRKVLFDVGLEGIE